jgi:hypothetical protein
MLPLGFDATESRGKRRLMQAKPCVVGEISPYQWRKLVRRPCYRQLLSDCG